MNEKLQQLKFCCITPDRGDRPQFLQNCIKQIKNQTIQPGEHFIINYAPLSQKPDLVDRIKEAVYMAKSNGFDIVFIIENDDYYPSDYLKNMLKPFLNDNIMAVGIDNSIYYNLFAQKYNKINHPGRASLFCTAFRIDALEGFKWPEPTNVFLDIPLWEHFNTMPYLMVKFPLKSPIGIKHGIGFCGGSGHNQNSYNTYTTDKDYQYLKTKIDSPSSLLFYKKIIKAWQDEEKQEILKIEKYQQTEKAKYTEIWNNLNYQSSNTLLFAKFLLKNTKQNRMLEIGCGNGETTLYLRMQKRFVLACDITLAAINKKYNQAGIFKECAAWNMPYNDMAFDYTFSTDVLEHIPTELIPLTIKEISRVTNNETIHCISTETDKQYCGHDVHLTVQPIEWWKQQFKEHAPNLKATLISRKELKNLNL